MSRRFVDFRSRFYVFSMPGFSGALLMSTCAVLHKAWTSASVRLDSTVLT